MPSATSQDTENLPQNLSALMESVNIAESLDALLLKTIGVEARKGFDYDMDSRKDWEQALDEWLKLAKQVREMKTFPWPNASNVKYPLLTTAAMQFAARAYPSLLPSDGKIVRARALGKDAAGQRTKIAEAISIFMSYQLLEDMDGWEEQMDKLLIMLPVVGTVFKKTYWDALNEKNCSQVVLPKNLVVNYWTKSLKDAERITEIIEMSPRKVKEKQQAGIWLNIDLGTPPMPDTAMNAPSNDGTTPYTICEQHTFLDLDEDGYKEPYIVTFHRETGKVLRITAGFDHEGVKMSPSGKLMKIDRIEYYTKFGFVPNPDGSFYDLGFGCLLGPINNSVNTLINQLIDSGTLNNLQSGFIGKGIRLRMGETRFNPGEWKSANATGDDLRKQIVPLPSKEPSTVLFQLMGSLITSGKELASVAEIFVGKMPGQNTPATTTMATIEQGMKVFTAVYKRLYRSLSEEFCKLARLNSIYLDPETEVQGLELALNPEDFDLTQNKIYPGADPTAVSQTEKLVKAQGLMELLPLGILDPVKVGIRVLEAQEQPNYEELLNQQVMQTGQVPQQPNPKLMETQAKIDAMNQASQIKQQDAAFKQQLDERDQQFKQAMEAQKNEQDARHKEVLSTLQQAIEVHRTNANVAQERAQFLQDTAHKEQSHQQKMRHANEAAATKKTLVAKQGNKPRK